MHILSRSISRGLAAAAAALLAACAPQVSTTRSVTPAPGPAVVSAAGPVKIALLAPSSAANPGAAALGRAIVNAARMAAEEVGDKTIRLMVYDTAGNVARTGLVMQEAMAAGARLVLGPLFSGNTKAIARTADANNVKVISFSTDSSAAGGPVYLSGFLLQKGAARVIGYARAKGISSFAVFYPDTVAGGITFDGASKAAGAGLVASASYERTTKGIVRAAVPFAREVKRERSDAVMIADAGQGLLFTMETLASRDITAERYRFLGLGTWNSASILKSNRFLNAWFPAPDPQAVNRFVQRYRARFGTVPPALAVLGYDAVQVAAQLVKSARADGTGNPFSAEAITRPQGFRGATGPIRFGRDGLGERGLVIMQVGDGKFDVVDPAPRTFGAGS